MHHAEDRVNRGQVCLFSFQLDGPFPFLETTGWEVPLSTEVLPLPTLVISALVFLAPVGWRRAIVIVELSLRGANRA